MGLAKHEVILLSTQNGQAVETDLSPDVVSIEVDQEVATDSDPQKITVVLADPEGKYDAGFVPQVDQLRITVFYVKQSPFKATPITDEDGTFKGWEMASSSTEEVFPVFEEVLEEDVPADSDDDLFIVPGVYSPPIVLGSAASASIAGTYQSVYVEG